VAHYWDEQRALGTRTCRTCRNGSTGARTPRCSRQLTCGMPSSCMRLTICGVSPCHCRSPGIPDHGHARPPRARVRRRACPNVNGPRMLEVPPAPTLGTAPQRQESDRAYTSTEPLPGLTSANRVKPERSMTCVIRSGDARMPGTDYVAASRSAFSSATATWTYHTSRG